MMQVGIVAEADPILRGLKRKHEDGGPVPSTCVAEADPILRGLKLGILGGSLIVLYESRRSRSHIEGIETAHP